MRGELHIFTQFCFVSYLTCFITEVRGVQHVARRVMSSCTVCLSIEFLLKFFIVIRINPLRDYGLRNSGFIPDKVIVSRAAVGAFEPPIIDHPRLIYILWISQF